jgi:hypothetical protein
VPNAKLLFISLESSDATVRAAFSVGGNGYIHKLRTHIDLIPGVEAVLAGKRFVSGDLAVEANTKQLGRHELHFYSDDSAFVEIGARFIADALKADGAAIVFATPSHREDLLERLKENAFDMDNAIQCGVYIAVDAAETLSNAMLNGRLDDARAAEVVTSLVQTSMRARRSEQARIAIFSEWSALLCAEGNIPAAIQLESGGNGVVEHQPIDIVCAYPLEVLHRHNADRTFNRICAAHTAVFSH